MVVCSECGAENRDEARFCDVCGAGLRQQQAPAREERKVVTVLFADLVGFTSRAEQMDPEDVRAVLEPYHARLRGELERFGGTVEKFIGDAVMALFGAPTSHEDDPERAVRAALAIRDWVREQDDLQLRIAVTTGEALVALGVRPSEGEGMASGDVVNTAARLQAAAPVNGILVDETTHRATSQAISYGEHEAVQAKGKVEPIQVWEAIEARSRLGVDVARDRESPLVGREKEIDLLRDALSRARQEESAQLVTIVGVPGIGKSRLVAELFGDIEADPDLIYWRQGRCLPYGEGVTYWSLSEMVKAQAGILDTDTEQEAERKLKASISELLPAAPDAAWVEEYLRPLVGLAEIGPARGDRRDEAFTAWRRFFEALAEQRPLVLVFEDLHWADDSLLDFVDHLVDWATSVPLLVVCTARPELLSRRPGWGGGKPNAAAISLSPLSGDETARLVHALLDRAVLPAEVQSTLIERAGGNPLYAEEFARMVAELGAGDEIDLRLPESVQGIIAARLDGLPLNEKLLLQDAAVIGKAFWLGAVERIGDLDQSSAEEVLHALERKEFVRRERRSSVGEQSQYVFRHLLVRDVAYSQIPRAARADKHRGAAEWIESLGRPDDHAEMLAHHYLNALEFAAAAGEEAPDVADRARVALRAAGDRARALGSFTSAAQFYDSALALWPADDPERAYVLLGYGSARQQAQGKIQGEEALSEASAALETLDPVAAAVAEIGLADLNWRNARHDDSARHRARAASLISGTERSEMKVYVLGQVARFHMLASEYDLSVRTGEEALAMAEDLGLEVERARLLNTIGSARAGRDDPEGLRSIEQSIALSRSLHTSELARGLNNLAHHLLNRGQLAAAEAVIEDQISVSREFGGDWIHWAQSKKLSLSYFLGRWDEAQVLADDAIGEIDKGLSHYLEGEWRMYRSRMRLARGSRAEATEDAILGLAAARDAGDPQIVAPLLSWNARLLGSGPEAEAHFDEFMDVWLSAAGVLGAATAVPDGGASAFALGRDRQFVEAAQTIMRTPWIEAAIAWASGELSRAADIFEEIGARPEEAYARLAAASQFVEGGQRARAESELQQSLAFWRSVDATAYVSEGEALLAAAS